MNINSENIAEFREQYELAVLANTEEFIFRDQPVLVSYAKYVLEYFGTLQEGKVDLSFIGETKKATEVLKVIQAVDLASMVFVIKPILGKNRLVVALNSKEGLVPLFIALDDELYGEVIRE